jgi:hypothetical protein
MNREDSVLDAIDELVDWQLEGGDRSDSFHGERMRQNQPCPWCPEPWHYLPITERLVEMRSGSYGRDEFGQGIVDPDYRYDQDESGVVCPGSEYHGPRHRTGMWDKQRRERTVDGSFVSSGSSYPGVPTPILPPGDSRRLRFIGPFDRWIIALDDELDIEDIFSERPQRIVTARRLTATFELDGPVKNPTMQWFRENEQDIDRFTMSSEGLWCFMRPIVVPFLDMEVHLDQPGQQFPSWVNFTTTYPIERHRWFVPFWRGLDDEAHEHAHATMEQFMQHYERRRNNAEDPEGTTGEAQGPSQR